MSLRSFALVTAAVISGAFSGPMWAQRPAFAIAIEAGNSDTHNTYRYSDISRYGYGGPEVLLQVSVKNTSGHEITPPPAADKPGAFSVIVRDENGNPPPPQKNTGPGVFSGPARPRSPHAIPTLAPGRSEYSTIGLGRQYDFKPGKYTIQVSRMDPETKVLVKSNVITITITP